MGHQWAVRDVNSRYNLWIAGTAGLPMAFFGHRILVPSTVVREPEAVVVLGACVGASNGMTSAAHGDEYGFRLRFFSAKRQARRETGNRFAPIMLTS